VLCFDPLPEHDYDQASPNILARDSWSVFTICDDDDLPIFVAARRDANDDAVFRSKPRKVFTLDIICN